MALHLEDHGAAAADVDHAGVLARPADHLGARRRQRPQVALRGLVGAVLVPHRRHDAELGEAGLAPDHGEQPVVLVRGQAMGRDEVGGDGVMTAIGVGAMVGQRCPPRVSETFRLGGKEVEHRVRDGARQGRPGWLGGDRSGRRRRAARAGARSGRDPRRSPGPARHRGRAERASRAGVRRLRRGRDRGSARGSSMCSVWCWPAPSPTGSSTPCWLAGATATATDPSRPPQRDPQVPIPRPPPLEGQPQRVGRRARQRRQPRVVGLREVHEPAVVPEIGVP